MVGTDMVEPVLQSSGCLHLTLSLLLPIYDTFRSYLSFLYLDFPYSSKHRILVCVL